MSESEGTPPWRLEKARKPCWMSGRAMQVGVLVLSIAGSLAYFAVRSTDFADRVMHVLGHKGYRPDRPQWSVALFAAWAVLFCAVPILVAALARRGGRLLAKTSRGEFALLAAGIVFLAGFMYAGETVYLTFPAAKEDLYLIWSDHFANEREAEPLRTDQGEIIINGDPDEVRNLVVADTIARHGLGGYKDAWGALPGTSQERDYRRWGVKQHPPLYYMVLALGGKLDGIRAYRWVQFVISVFFMLALAGALEAHGFKRAPVVALLVLAIPAMVVRELSGAQNDILVAAFVTLAVWFLAYLDGRKGLLWAALAGVALGAGMWTKYTAFISAGAIVLFVLVASRKLPVKRRLLYSAVVIFVAAMVFLPLVFWLRGTLTGLAQWKDTIKPMIDGVLLRITASGEAPPARSSMGVTAAKLPILIPVAWGIPFCLAAGLGVILSLWQVWRRRELRHPMLGALVFLAATWAATLIQNPLWRYTMPATWALVAVAANGIASVFTDRTIRAAYIAHLVLFALTKEIAYILEYAPVV